MPNHDLAHDDEFNDEPVSKSELKRQMHELQAFGEQIVGLNNKDLQLIPLEGELADAVSLARTMKADGARKRQIQYIGRLLRSADIEPIRHAFEELSRRHNRDIQRQHEIEGWRERLLTDDRHALTEFIDQYPTTDIQAMRTLIRQCRSAKGDNQKKTYRLLFKEIRRSMDAE